MPETTTMTAPGALGAASAIDISDRLPWILAEEASGRSRKAIAAELGVAYLRLCKELVTLGYPAKVRSRRSISEDQIAEGVRLVSEEGLTYVAAAIRVGVTAGVLQHWVGKEGVRVGRRVKLTDEQVAAAAAELGDGARVCDVAARYGVTSQTLTHRVRRHRNVAAMAAAA